MATSNPASMKSAQTSRRKFSLFSEVALAIRRYNLTKGNDGNAWRVQLDRQIVKIVCDAHHASFLYVNGTCPETYKLPVQTIPELMEYLKLLPVPEPKEETTSKRLKLIPLFSKVKRPSANNNPLIHPRPTMHNKLKDPPTFMLACYKRCEQNHKTIEHHHPDGIGWNGGINATIECVFDVFNSLLRTNSLRSSYNKLFSILLDDKFSNLDLQGIFYAFLHISIRGVSGSELFYTLSNWRREPVSQELLFKVTLDFANGIPPPSIIKCYLEETMFHMRTMDAELKRLRMPNSHHDFTKMDADNVFYYTWHWGVYQRLSDTNKHRFASGMYEVCSNSPYTPSGVCNPTMFSMGTSVGHSIGQGISESPAVKEIIQLLKNLPDVIDQKIDGLTKNTEAISEKLIDKNAKMTEEAGAHLIEKFNERSHEIGEKLISHSIQQGLGPALEALESFKSFISTVIGNALEFLKPLPGFGKVNVSAGTIFEALQSYVLYINTESTVIKTFLVFKILNSFGLLRTAFDELGRFWSWTKDTVHLNGEEVPAAETSSILDWISSAPQNVIKIIGALIASVAKGASLTSSEFFSYSKTIAEKLKNFHFISQGIMGISKLFELIKKAYETTVEWFSEHILGRTPEREQYSRQAIKLMVKIKYFHTEAGMNAIRMSEPVRQQAEAILSEYISLQAAFKLDKEYRHLYNDLEKLSRPVREISDFVTRLRNISNFQPTMFHVQLVGRPGIGKSTITKNIVNDLSKTLWPEEPKASFYSYNTDLEYFDGYAGQKIMIVDDLYKINDPKHLTTSMFLVTNTPVILPMANLNDKGVQMTSEVLLTSTNTAYPLGKDVLCMEAIHRRRHMLVEVICDPEVLDSSLGQFSMALFKRKYGDAVLSDFPHLTFNLLRPVPQEFGGAMSVDGDEFEIYREYAQKLKDANKNISMATQRLDPTFYFSEANAPPQGITLPATGWSYAQLISNCAVRFSAFRGAEGTYTTKSKFIHVERCLAEIDALLDQESEIDDEQAAEIPITKSIERLLCRAQHPYGTTDEIGERIFAQDEPVAPELEHIDFDKIVDEILNEKTSNPTGLNLQEEQERTRNILRRRNKSPRDPILRDQLKILDMPDGRRVIPLTSHFTSWYAPPVVDQEQFAKSLALLMQEGYLREFEVKYLKEREDPNFFIALGKIMKGTTHQNWRNKNNIIRWACSHSLFYPDKDIFPESIRGTDSKIPIAFFRDMFYQNGQWYFDVSNIAEVPELISCETEVSPYLDGPKYKVRMDVAFFLSTMQTYRNFTNEFDAMTLEQQKALVEEASWRSMYTGTYTYEGVAEQCSSIFAKLGYKALHYMLSPMRYFAERYPIVLSLVAAFGIYFTVIYTLTKISELFNPNPTSKHLHKAPQSSLLFHGRPTAQNANTFDIARSIVSRSVREVILSDSNAGVKSQALFSEQYIILNKHVFRQIKDNEIQIAVQSTMPDKEWIRYIIDRKSILEDPNGDLAIIYSQNLPAMRKVTQHLMTNQEYMEHDFPEDLIFLSNTKFGTIIDHHSNATKYSNLYLSNKQYRNTIDQAILVKGTTMTGRSGSPVVTTVQGRPRIVGIQAWEVDVLVSPKIAIQILTFEKFEQLLSMLHNQLGMTPIVRVEEPELMPVNGQETSAFEEVDPVHIITTDQHQVGHVARSQIKPSIIYDELKNMGIDTDSIPAALNQKDKRLYHGTKIHPLAHSLGKYFRGNIEPFQPKILTYCASNLIDYLKVKLDKTTFRTLTFNEAITGTREDGSNPMNLKSSPGIPFIFEERELKGKRLYIQIDELGDVSFVDPKFRRGYEQFLFDLGQRKVPYTRAYDFPKDELRPQNKALGTSVTPPKTRSVTCMNVYYIIAWRQITLDFWATMHRAANGTIPFCPGINPEGPEWNNLFHYLNQHTNAVDFDVSNWDGFLRTELFYKSCDIIKEITKLSQEHCNIIDSIAYEVMNSYIQFGNIIYQKGRGLVSGFPGTAEINTMSHWLLILYIYMLLTKDTPFNTFAAFLQHVSCAIYGDDLILTFSDEIKPIFNGITIAQVYRDIGYPVTSADKNKDIVASKPLMECTFLKSTWRELIPYYYVRKMDQSVIHNLVLWTRSRQDPKLQFYENYMDALRLAFGCGPSTFYKFRECVNLALARSNRDIIAFDYLDFERDYFQRYIPDYYTKYLKFE